MFASLWRELHCEELQEPLIPAHVDMRIHKNLEKLGHIEGTLLSRHVKTPFRRHLVRPQGKDWAINTLVLNGPNDADQVIDPTRKTIVLTHGFGSGLGFFYTNYDHLSSLVDVSKKPVQIVAIDWLGSAGSSRPRFTKRSNCTNKPDNNDALIEDAEAYFVDSFEEWRESVGLEKFALAGHSLGGYLSSVYALKYPERLSSLTLISPFGLLPHPPESLAVTPELSKELPLAQRMFLYAWRNNVTPQWVLRGLGPYGPKMASRVVSRRFPTMDEFDQRLVADYVYHLNGGPAAGEYALNALMEIRMTPGEEREDSRGRKMGWNLYARHPVGIRLAEGLPSSLPLNIIFGDHDWMFAKREEMMKLDVIRARAQSRLHVLDNAGHHLYLDNPHGMMDVFRKAKLWG
ncbi:hypothetical protein HDU98_012052 [Podochytrium sp. JEL0797]|nr:hypothetical protein HDU98_012052 [Podochytrium sp. JEL0797]